MQRFINPKEIVVFKEYRNYLPALTKEEQTNLENDIKKNGIRDPLIIVRGGKYLLDGHNRRDIAIKLKIDKVPYEVQDTDDAKLWIITHQLSRRNLTEIQRDELIAELAKRTSRKEAAVTAKVSTKTVDRIVKQQAAIKELPKEAKKEIQEKGTRREANKTIKKHQPIPENTRIKGMIWELKNALTNIIDQAENLDEEKPFAKDSVMKRLKTCIKVDKLSVIIQWLDEQEKKFKNYDN